jgi:hypothetical protein
MLKIVKGVFSPNSPPMEGWQANACGVVSFGTAYGKDWGKIVAVNQRLY